MIRRSIYFAAFSLALLALSTASARAASLYSFDAPTTDGWQVADYTPIGVHNLSAPSTTTARSHSGTHSLAYPLSFTPKASYGIDDAAFVNAAAPFDLTSSTGVTLYVYVTTGAGNGNPVHPLQGNLLVWDDNWDYHEGPTVSIPRNQWTKLTLNFNSVGISSHSAIPRIGLKVWGALYDTGSATLYIDSVQSGLGDDVAAPGAPTGAGASNPATGNRLNLSWSAPGDSDLDHYNVYRSTVSGALSTKTLVKSVAAGGTSYGDVSVMNGITYYYGVTAVDKSGNESASSTEFSGTPSGGAAAYDRPMKGMCYVSFSTGEYSSVDSDSALDDLAATGANYVSIIVTEYMTNGTANSIAPDASKTPSEADVAAAIADAQARGFSVILKPHVDILGGTITFRGDIAPTNAASWFSSYNTFITKYAQIARDNDVGIFVVGTELRSMTDNRTSDWTTIINNVKTILSGSPAIEVTYSANLTRRDDEYAHVGFWDQLDYVGYDVYIPLVGHDNPTLDELKKGWSFNNQNESPLQILADWREYTGKDVIITEIGYQSANGASYWPYGTPGAVSMTEQDNTYQAAFAALGTKSWLQGLFWWHWSPTPNDGGAADTDYTPQNKPALDTLTAQYGAPSVQAIYNFQSGVQGWRADFTGDYANNFSTPTTANQGGSLALAYPLNLDDKVGGVIKDFGYVEPNLASLGGYKGIRAKVMIPNGAGVDATSPATVALVIQTGSGYDWCQSNTFRNLTPGLWREVSLDFSSAECFAAGNTGKGKVVQNINDVRRIGLSISGAGATSSGDTTLYMDDLGTKGTGNMLGMSFSAANYSFGALTPSSGTAAASSIDITSLSNVTSVYSLHCSSSAPGNWAPSTSTGTKTFILNAQFNATKPGSFNTANQAVSLVKTASSGTRFAGGETGNNVAAGDVRHLWLEFRAPSTLTEAADLSAQTISLTVTSEVQ